MAITSYGDISPRTAAYASKEMLKRGIPLNILEKYMQAKPLPANNTKSMTWRRYLALALATTPLTEGVTPSSKKLTKTDVTANLAQYGDLIEITDVIADTHEDQVLREATDILGEQSVQTIETMRWGIIKAGTNKFYTNAAADTDVNTPLNAGVLKKVVRALKRQNAMMITSVGKSTPDFNSESVLPCYVAAGHTDLEGDIRGIAGFIDVKDYRQEVLPGEIGGIGNIRFVLSNLFSPITTGTAAKGLMVSTGGVNADVYSLVVMAKDAWAGVALKGAFAITPTVINPVPSKSDPLGQRGYVAWKTMQTAVILNDAWLAVVQCAATEL